MSVERDPVRRTEKFIEGSDLFGGWKTLLAGRGACALMLLYDTIPGDGRVLLPAIGCPSILATVLLSNRQPVIVDVDQNLSIDPVKVREVIKSGDIVLGVHTYGIPCAIEELERICEENEAYLVEDAAQAIGGNINGRPLGTFGYASVLSFASSKILPTNGGGAILTKHEDLYNELNPKVRNLPPYDERVSGLAAKHRNILTESFNRARKGAIRAASIFQKIYHELEPLYIHGLDDDQADDIEDVIGSMSAFTRSRWDNAELYRNEFKDLKVELLEYPRGCVPFRYTFILPELAGFEVQDITDEIRREIVHASNLYLPLHWLAPDLVITDGCPRAEFASVRLINLWVEGEVAKVYAPKVKDVIGRWTIDHDQQN